MSFTTIAFAPSQGDDPAESHPENNEFGIIWPDSEVSPTDLVTWLRLFVEDGQFFEIRYPKAKAERLFRRFNADLAKAVEEALRWSGQVPGVYFTLQGKSGPGRPGWSPTQVPHRSGLAHHAHPVPHLMNSRPARSVVVTWTWFRSRCTCQVSLQRLMRRHPLPLTGVPRVGSPASTVL